jgi:Tol biopolymer transport system component
MAIAFDAVNATASGSPVGVLEGVLATGAIGPAQFAITRGGSLVYVDSSQTRAVPTRRLAWLYRDGREEPLDIRPGAYVSASISPDANRIALASVDGTRDIWVWDVGRKTMSQLTLDARPNSVPVWTRDGKKLAFRTGSDVDWQSADGLGVPERLVNAAIPWSFTPGDKSLLASTASSVLALISLDGSRSVSPISWSVATGVLNAALSPNGRWIAYQADPYGQGEVFLRSSEAGDSAVRQISSGGGLTPVWSKDGRELFYHRPPDTIIAVQIEQQGDTLTLGASDVAAKGVPILYRNSPPQFDVFPDGKRLLVFRNASSAPGAPAESAPAAQYEGQIHFIGNFGDELRRLVPTK